MRILLVNQAFYPDVVSSAQHAADLARELASRGHEVTVVTSRRGYDNPQARFASREVWEGVRILRVACTGFGKRAKWRRAADFASFLAACFCRLITLPRFDVVVAMSSPPLLSFVAALAVAWRGGRLILWVMDLNPDEAVAAGWLREGSLVCRLFERALRFSLRKAEAAVVLDRFMKYRLVRKGAERTKTIVIPPWSHDQTVGYDPQGRRQFRDQHGLAGKFVVMYSGNHSPCHPLDTLLEAAERLRTNQEIVFCFIGGGSEFARVRQFASTQGLPNVVCLPYQPLEGLSASLSAADLHVVVMGNPFVGIVHPCKIYNILRTGIPLLYIGPEKSHVGDVLGLTAGSGSNGREASGSKHIRHGEVKRLVDCLLQCATAARRPPIDHVQPVERFSVRQLLPKLVSVLEKGPRPAEEPATRQNGPAAALPGSAFTVEG